ncbi:hypothetical protein TNCV_2018411 [Trichonephila clavipes]|nr:hypothetical protein TNCV_2018411 [Trichonephila clavipes]
MSTVLRLAASRNPFPTCAGPPRESPPDEQEAINLLEAQLSPSINKLHRAPDGEEVATLSQIPRRKRQ